MIEGGLGGLSQHPVAYLSVLPRYGMNDWGFPTTSVEITISFPTLSSTGNLTGCLLRF